MATRTKSSNSLLLIERIACIDCPLWYARIILWYTSIIILWICPYYPLYASIKLSSNLDPCFRLESHFIGFSSRSEMFSRVSQISRTAAWRLASGSVSTPSYTANASKASQVAMFKKFNDDGSFFYARPKSAWFADSSYGASDSSSAATPQTELKPGSLSFTLGTRVSEATSTSKAKYDKVNFSLQARSIGQFLSAIYGPVKPGGDVFTSFNKRSTMKVLKKHAPGGDFIMVVSVDTLDPSNGTQNSARVELSSGDAKCLQVLIENCLPSLYGWVSKNVLPDAKKAFGTSSATKAKTAQSAADVLNM